MPLRTCDTLDYRFSDAVKDPGESLKVSLNLYTMCVIPWRPNEAQSAAEFIRPTVPNGFSYECTTAGTTGTKEPRWPTTISATVTDGSVTWTCRAASGSGVNAITSPTATSDPTGLTIASVSVSELHKILATYSGGTEGQSYDAVYSFTLDGVTRIARQAVLVHKR